MEEGVDMVVNDFTEPPLPLPLIGVGVEDGVLGLEPLGGTLAEVAAGLGAWRF